ncbi:hypothetical protein IW249_006418 [Micromonospora vinacea]|uniref:Uncharacterized protein n=1 Tax=Micromonospora vinacea TaxID=709878 RepID=A0ABS0KBJ3_9ACTN|nr:hypothetical protein [Micromonospora vinacea]MBG6106004.1 hypothetical protein [Micromonospora vinacea]
MNGGRRLAAYPAPVSAIVAQPHQDPPAVVVEIEVVDVQPDYQVFCAVDSDSTELCTWSLQVAAMLNGELASPAARPGSPTAPSEDH